MLRCYFCSSLRAVAGLTLLLQALACVSASPQSRRTAPLTPALTPSPPGVPASETPGGSPLGAVPTLGARPDAGSVEPAPPPSPGRTAAPGASLCGGDLLWCDDFDSYAAGAVSGKGWTVSTNNGTASVDQSQAHSGQQALRVAVPAASYARAFLEVAGAPVFPVPGNSFFGRMFVFAPSLPSGSVHWTLLQGEGTVAGRSFQAYYRYGGQFDGRLMANYETQGAASDCWRHASETLPLNQWTCVEWQLVGPENTMRLWLNGQAVDDAAVVKRGEGCVSSWSDDWLAPQFAVLHVGWEQYQASDARQLWVDDLALATSRIGCAPR